ncbi:MAG: hypothetical protein R2720_13325 [Candidatus Nanopelagicales bacterium]
MTERPSDSTLAQLRRWEESGGVWRVVARSGGFVDIALLTCSAGEQVSRLHTDEPLVLAYVGDRESSDQ